MPLSLSAAARDRLLSEGVRLTSTFDLQPGTQQVRVIVRDAATGAIGSVFIDAERLRKAAGRRETVALPR